MQHKCCCHGWRPPRVRASDWADTTNPGHVVPGTPSPTTTPPLRVGSPLCVRAVHVAIAARDLAARRPVRLGLAARVEGCPAWPAALRIFNGRYRFRGSAQLGVSDQDQIYGCSDSPDSVGASVFRQRGCRSDRCNRSRRSCYRHRRSRRTDTRCGYRSGRCNRRKHRLHTSPNSCRIGR